jgi:lycopene cyclase domain-containing protein
VKSEYLIVLVAILCVPLLLSRDRNLRLYAHPRRLLVSIAIPSMVFWIWDLAAAARGHWWFNDRYILGIRLLGLPIEEWLFFPVVCFVSIFVWESVNYFTHRGHD